MFAKARTSNAVVVCGCSFGDSGEAGIYMVGHDEAVHDGVSCGKTSTSNLHVHSLFYLELWFNLHIYTASHFAYVIML